jgi:ribonucleoside-triphosphate reductase (thioredoxin)
MLGVGVGFDTKGENSILIKKPKEEIKIYKIEDSREGWVHSVELLLDSYFKGTEAIQFDYSSVRGAGEAIKTFGGISSGPVPLMELHASLRECLSNQEGKPLSVTSIVDIMNLIGKCVVSGNVRRTAEIAFGEESSEFLNLKDYDVNPKRSSYGWTSNNSIFATIGMNYEKISQKILKNGEPGLAWLSNMRDFSRMNGVPDYLDNRGLYSVYSFFSWWRKSMFRTISGIL